MIKTEGDRFLHPFAVENPGSFAGRYCKGFSRVLYRLCSKVIELRVRYTTVRKCLVRRICQIRDTEDYHKSADLMTARQHYYSKTDKESLPKAVFSTCFRRFHPHELS